MRGVVLVVLDVEGDQRVVPGDADRRDPSVIDRVRVAALLGSRLDVAPGDRHALVERQEDDVAAPGCQVFELARSLVADDGPLGQLAQGPEGNAGG